MDFYMYQIEEQPQPGALLYNVFFLSMGALNVLLLIFLMEVTVLFRDDEDNENNEININIFHENSHDGLRFLDLICGENDELPLYIREFLDTVTEPLPIEDLP